jgi:PilZ domain
MSENRMFQRIRFVTETEVAICGISHGATLVDISLKGALLAFHDAASPENGQSCHLRIRLDQSDVTLSFTGMVAHSHDNLTGIRFVTVDIATMIHLRSLLELNSGDPELIRSELNAFIDSH